MTGDLCNQLTGKNDGQQTLEKLEAANLFIVPLDAEKRWYRYHHLFAELLRFRLSRQPTANLSELHLKASRWYKTTGLMDEAVYHAIQSGQAEEIERLLNAVVDLITRDNQLGIALKWFEAIPAELIKQRVGLTLFKSWFLALADQTEQSTICAEMGKVLLTLDSPIFEQGILEATLAYNARLQLDIPAAIEHGEKAQGLLSEKYTSIRNVMLMLVGQAKLLVPEYFDEGLQQVKKALAEARKLENRFALGSSLSTLVFILIGQARLREAMLLLDQFENHQDSVKWVRALRATIYYLRNELQKATDELGKVIKEEQGAILDLINNAWAYVLRGLVYRGEGNTTKALEIFRQIEDAGVSLPPTIRVAPYKFTLLVEMGRLEEATFWATEKGFTPNDPIPPEMDDYYLCYTRILIAQQHFSEALTVLKTLEELASSLDTNYRLATVRILQAIVFIKTQRRSLAKDYLSKAVALVAPANIIRTFLDEDPLIVELLIETRATAPQFVDAILAAYRQKPEESSPLVEPLSEREEEILRLIAQGLSNREIGERLYLAVGTVKRHAVNIFGKLEVNSRTEAVARARELNLL
jgi:LuxR family maltose regulon positive regulatory protein